MGKKSPKNKHWTVKVLPITNISFFNMGSACSVIPCYPKPSSYQKIGEYCEPSGRSLGGESSSATSDSAERLFVKLDGLVDKILPIFGAVEEDPAATFEAMEQAAEHKRAHEMCHSVECLAGMLAERIVQDNEENKRREEIFKRTAQVSKLREMILVNTVPAEKSEESTEEPHNNESGAQIGVKLNTYSPHPQNIYNASKMGTLFPTTKGDGKYVRISDFGEPSGQPPETRRRTLGGLDLFGGTVWSEHPEKKPK
jgi:hypothetical protein